MAHAILSVKLSELDKKIGQVHSRIQLSETESHDRIRAASEAMRKECSENERTLRNRLQFSKSAAVAGLAALYDRIEGIIREARKAGGGANGGMSAEEKILYAEYALDFAMQAANHALLISLEAMDAQMEQQEKEEGNI